MTKDTWLRRSNALTVGELLRFVAPEYGRKKTPPPWPPDVFALAMGVLARSGAYSAVVDGRWAPDEHLPGEPGSCWADRVRHLASEWRRRSLEPDAVPPRAVSMCWRRILEKATTPVESIGEDWELCCDLLTMVAASDEACQGAGLRSQVVEDPFVGLSVRVLLESSSRGAATLCRDIHPSKLAVLPKLHTPQSGLTVRSLSHHLALWPAGTVQAR